MDILAIAAHPGEIERTCGGTLLKLARAGHTVAVIDLTDGSMGTHGAPERNVEQSMAAAEILQISHRENLHFPDARLENTMPARMTLAQRIRDLGARTVILPHWDTEHPDHARASELAREACFLAGLPRLDQYTPVCRPERILYASGLGHAAPTLVTDISNEFEIRMEAIKVYADVFNHELREDLTVRARYFGRMIGTDFGEPFVVKGVMRVPDLMAISVA